MVFFKAMSEKRRNIYMLTVELILIAAVTAGLILGISAVRKDAYLTTLNWPESDFLPEFSDAAPVLDYLDTGGFSQNEQILAASLQSVVNKTRSRLYLSAAPPEDDPAARALELKFNPPTSDLYETLGKYREELRGIVVWDPEEPHTANLAAVVGAAKRCVVADGDQAERLAADYGLPVVEDLRGRYADRLEVYRAMLDGYADKSAQRLIMGCNPAGSTALWDYAAAAGALRVWLDPSDPEEAALLDDFLARMPAGKSVYMGDWPDGENAPEMASSRGVTSLAGADNLSVYAAVAHKQPPDKTAEAAPPPATKPENKLYIALVAGTGDLEESRNRLPALWASSRASQLPMSWSLSPALLHTAPALWDHLRDTASGLDCFVNPTAGFGNFNPLPWNDGESLLQFYKRSDVYAAVTPYAAYSLPAGWDDPLSPQAAEGLTALYVDNLPHLQALLDPETEAAVQYDSMLRLPLRTAGSADELERVLREAAASYGGGSPAFMAVQAPLLEMEQYEALAACAAAENSAIAYVTVDDCLALFRGQTETSSAPSGKPAARVTVDSGWDPYDLTSVTDQLPGPSPWRYVGATVLSLLLLAAALLQFRLLERARKRKENSACV